MKLSESLNEALEGLQREYSDFLAEGTRFPVGTVRDWKRKGKTVKMKKTGHMKWEPVNKVAREEAHEFKSAKEKLGSFLGRKTASVDGQSLVLDPELTGKSVEEHEQIATEVLGRHSVALEDNLAMLTEMFPGAQIYGRVKTVPSAITKLTRKPKHFGKYVEGPGGSDEWVPETGATESWLPIHQLSKMLDEAARGERTSQGYGTVRDLGDSGGMRVVLNSIQEVEAAVKKLHDKFPGPPVPKDLPNGPAISSEDNYLGDSKKTNRNYPYRSYHVNIVRNGLVQEIQFRTKNQDRWGDWYHDAYKPHTEAQKTFFEANKKMINDYAEKISDYFKAIESGKRATKPKCPDPIRPVFGCL